MPWKEVGEMKLRNEFVVRVSSKGANISELCREYGISRSVGYKLLNRYRQEGIKGVAPYSRRPKGHNLAISPEMTCEVIKLRIEHPTWGSRIIRELLLDMHQGEQVPCARTIDRIFLKADLVKKRRRGSGRWLDREPLKKSSKPNQIWTVDFKGWWNTRDRKPCFPLTIRDAYSRFVLDIKALRGTSYEDTKAAFEQAFERYGLPEEILSDNGTPFATVLALQGLTRLSAWWVKLGIRPRRILPGCPFMNGSHERMHRDIKAELQQNPARNLKDEQSRFDEWRNQYNTIRPNQAVGMKRPAQVYSPSTKPYPLQIHEFEYPESMMLRRIDSRGHLYWKQRRRFIAGAISGETVGLELHDNNLISVWYCELKLGSTNQNFDYPLGGNRLSPYACRHHRNR